VIVRNALIIMDSISKMNQRVAKTISILKLVQGCKYIVVPWINMIYVWYFPYINRLFLTSITNLDHYSSSTMYQKLLLILSTMLTLITKG